MNVLIVGSGAREHALAWRIGQSPNLGRMWVAGGNYGTAALATNLDVGPGGVDCLTAAARKTGADLVVVGPEAPLAEGLADALAELEIPVFGPSRAAARLESSKSFALDLMRETGVPSPDYRVFSDEPAALSFLERNSGPIVVKADGLAAGKGVTVCASSDEAAVAVRASMSGRLFGEAGATVVLEEALSGPEVSVFAFCDGENISPLVAACDYKRLRDGGEGPNTGGMGSYASPEFWTPALATEVEHNIVRPVVAAMAERDAPYRGVLYAGLMLTGSGPKVLEFNCRLGDPETQVVLPLLASDPLELMTACWEGRLDCVEIRWDARYYVGVVMASGGYPDRYPTGLAIDGLDCAVGGRGGPDSMVFTAGVAAGPDGAPVTSGGRVLTVVGGGDSLEEARNRAYRRLEGISFPGAQWRTDIALANEGG